MRIILLPLLIITMSITIFSQELPFKDNFSQGLANWTFIDDEPQYSGPGNWLIDNNVLRQTSNIWAYSAPDEFKYHLGTHAVAGNKKWTDYSFNLICRATDNDGIGVVFRYIDKKNYYRFIIVEDNGNGGPVKRLQKFINGEPTTIYEKIGSPAIPDNWFSLTANLRGDSIAVYINGELFTKQRDTHFIEGKIGLACYAMSGAYFDSISVTTKEIIYDKPEPEDFMTNRKPYIQLSKTNSVVIAWNTKDKKIGRVDYGLTEQLNQSITEDSLTKKHNIKIDKLLPNTKYYYKVYNNNLEFSELRYFYTAKPDSIKDVSFFVIGDSGTDTEPQWKIAELLEKDSADFMIHVGDVSQASGEEYDNIFFKPYENIVDKMCVYTCIGNHDTYYDDAKTYLDNFYLPSNNSENSERYYSFEWGNTFFINIDSNIDYTPGSPQYKFIESQLKSDEFNAADWTFAYFHHPPYCELWDSWGGEQAVIDYLLPLFEKYKLDMVLNGHTHGYERGMLNGIYYIISGGGGGGLDYYARNWSHIQKSESKHHYTKINVEQNKLTLKAIDIDGNELDSMGILKSPTDVKDNDRKSGIITEYLLNQNYPNPFNPTTKIAYQLPEEGFVELKVFNSLGKEITTLVRDNKSAGNYQVDFNGSNLSSGIYICQLKSNHIIKSIKMTLIK